MGKQVIRSGDKLIVGADNPVAPTSTEVVRLVGKRRVEGGVERKFTTVTFAMSPYPVTDADEVLLCASGGGAITITLQAVAVCNGRELFIFDWDGLANVNNITIAAQMGETINGLATIAIVTSYGGAESYCDATVWKTIGTSV